MVKATVVNSSQHYFFHLPNPSFILVRTAAQRRPRGGGRIQSTLQAHRCKHHPSRVALVWCMRVCTLTATYDIHINAVGGTCRFHITLRQGSSVPRSGRRQHNYLRSDPLMPGLL